MRGMALDGRIPSGDERATKPTIPPIRDPKVYGTVTTAFLKHNGLVLLLNGKRVYDAVLFANDVIGQVIVDRKGHVLLSGQVRIVPLEDAPA